MFLSELFPKKSLWSEYKLSIDMTPPQWLKIITCRYVQMIAVGLLIVETSYDILGIYYYSAYTTMNKQTKRKLIICIMLFVYVYGALWLVWQYLNGQNIHDNAKLWCSALSKQQWKFVNLTRFWLVYGCMKLCDIGYIYMRICFAAGLSFNIYLNRHMATQHILAYMPGVCTAAYPCNINAIAELYSL